MTTLHTATAAIMLYLAAALAPCFGRNRYFASGSNRAGEIRGLARSGCDFGVAAPEMMSRKGCTPLAAMAELEAAAVHEGVRCFVDSGAFSEVVFTADGPSYPKPMGHTEWRRVFKCYALAAAAFGNRCFVVAPDRVASQAVTIERQERYAHTMRKIAATGCNVLVPVQKGALDMASFYALELVSLGLPAATTIPAIPMKKDATSIDDLLTFVRTVRPSRIHLLGLGPKSKSYNTIINAIAAIVPECEVMCDSVLMSSIAGRTNGRKCTGKRRPLTVAMDQIKMRAPELADSAERRALAIELLANMARPTVPAASVACA